MDGVDLLKHLRVHCPEIPVIAISGGAPGRATIEYSAALAATFGADAVFFKPFDNEELVAAVREISGAADDPAG